MPITLSWLISGVNPILTARLITGFTASHLSAPLESMNSILSCASANSSKDLDSDTDTLVTEFPKSIPRTGMK